jgi:hypothetical protein
VGAAVGDVACVGAGVEVEGGFDRVGAAPDPALFLACPGGRAAVFRWLTDGFPKDLTDAAPIWGGKSRRVARTNVAMISAKARAIVSVPPRDQ